MRLSVTERHGALFNINTERPISIASKAARNATVS